MGATATAIETVVIKKGELAKFDGVLMPEWQFKKVNEDLIAKDIYKVQALAPKEESNDLKSFAIGFLAGSAAVLIAEKIGGK